LVGGGLAFLEPRIAEQAAAAKDKTAANANAIVKADMNGPEIELGKKVGACSTPKVSKQT